MVIKTDLDPNALLTTKEGGVDEKGAGSILGEIEFKVGKTETKTSTCSRSYVLICNLVEKEEARPRRTTSSGCARPSLFSSSAEANPRPAVDAGRGRLPQAAARRAGLEDVVESSYGHGSAWLVGSPLIAQLPAITRHCVCSHVSTGRPPASKATRTRKKTG